jgi:hypothetical protein
MVKNSFIILLLGMLLGAVGPVRAGGSLRPDIPLAQSRFSDTQGCVEPTEDMRRNHMEYILHQRDKTVHKGVRTKQHSLVECITCHVSDAQDAPHVNSEEHFCNSCHSYAAVSIDCFQCHADRPASAPRDTETGATLQDSQDGVTGKRTTRNLEPTASRGDSHD